MVKYTIDELKENIYLKIKDYGTDKRLRKKLIKDFVTKGLGNEVPNQVIQGSMEIEQLDEKTELICLAKSMNEYLSNKFDDDILKLSNYLSSDEITEYTLKQINKPEKSNIIMLEDVTKISSNTYMTHLSAEQISTMRENRTYSNLQGFQRPRIKKISRSGKPYEVIDSNKEGIKDLKERFIKGDIFPTAIAFSIIQLEGKDPVYNFVKYKKNEGNKEKGTLVVETNYDIDSINYTPFAIVDGYHRFTGMADAYDEEHKNKRNLENGLGVLIFVMNEEEAKQYVVDSLKRNDVKDREALNSMTPSNESKFVDIVIKSSNILKNNVVDTFDKIKDFKKLTSQKILENSTKLGNFSLGSEILAEKEATRTGDIIDLLVDYIKDSYFDGDINKMKKTYLLDPNMFAGYISIADKLAKDIKYKKSIADIGDELFLLVEDESIKELKLNHQKCSIEDVFNYFDNLVEGVINE